MTYSGVLIWLWSVCLTFVFEVTAEEECDTTACSPSAFYKAIDCTPVFETDLCCPNRYECERLYSRIELDMEEPKCYFKGHEYEIGQEIQKEDADLCEKNCICVRKPNHLADFHCTSNLKDECPPYVPTREGCYMRNSIEQCCPTEEICPRQLEEVTPVCTENGKTYLDRQYIVSEDKPNKICKCQVDKLNGTQSISCTEFNNWSDVHAVYLFHKGCAPVYHVDDVGSMVIHRDIWRCQNDNDSVIDRDQPLLDPKIHGPLLQYACRYINLDSEKVEICLRVNPDGPIGVIYDFSYRYMCRFGQLTMHIGDMLNSIQYNDQFCIDCFCVLPPAPTCMLMMC